MRVARARVGWEEDLLPMPMGSKRRAAAAQLLRFFPPPFLPPLRLAFFPALEIAAARDFGMPLRLSALYFRLFASAVHKTHRRSQTWNLVPMAR